MDCGREAEPSSETNSFRLPDFTRPVSHWRHNLRPGRWEPILLTRPEDDKDAPGGEAAGEPGWWKDELTRRVEDFRQKRAARLGRSADSSPGTSPDRSSSGDEPPRQDQPTVEGNVLRFPKGEASQPEAQSDREAEFEAELQKIPDFLLEGTLEDSAAEDFLMDEALRERPASEVPASEVKGALDASLEPDQIPPSFGFQIGHSTLPMQVAPFGRRLGAGLIDALILAAGFGLFAGIFHLTGHLTGGTVSNTPLNWLIGGSIAALFAAVYFGAFTALRHATPGLLALGIEVRNLDGEPPSPKQSFWRALGYLVSGGSFLLGFIWSLVDEERLTWHDRISETFLVLSEEIEISNPPPNT